MPSNYNAAAPKAHLNYLFFNDDLQLVADLSGKIQVSPNGIGTGGWQTVGTGTEICNCTAVNPGSSGYIAIYVDNQSIGKKVWFDDLHIEHYTSEVLEEDHYYPFGLTVGVGQTGQPGLPGQPYKLTTKELETAFDLNIYDFGARMFDMQLGRWQQIDPLSDKYLSLSPYNYCANNPTMYVDLDGRKIDPASQDQVDQLKVDIAQKNIDILGRQNLITSAATDLNGNVNYSQSENAELSELKFRQGELSTATSELSSMESDQNFTFKLNAVSGSIATLSQNAGDLKNGIYTLSYLKGDVGNQIHEVIKHGAQIARGEFIFSADQSGNVTASTKMGFNNIDLEVSAYKAQYSYLGIMQTYTEPVAGSREANMNAIINGAGTPNQVNTPTTVTNHSQINATLIKSMMETAIGNVKIY